MSLARTALRLQAIEALNAEPVICALVQGRCFDSRIGAIDHREPVPVILVTTEETKGDAWERQNGGGTFAQSCDLVLEVAMNLVEGADDDLTIGVVSTDRELEACLDLIEEHAILALTDAPSSAAKLLRTNVVRRVSKFASARFATDQTGEKLAIRLLTLTVELFTYEPDDPFDLIEGPFAALPEPLRTIAAALPAGSARETCAQLAARLTAPAPPPLPGFTGADLVFAPQVGAGPPDRTDDIAADRVVRDAVHV